MPQSKHAYSKMKPSHLFSNVENEIQPQSTPGPKCLKSHAQLIAQFVFVLSACPSLHEPDSATPGPFPSFLGPVCQSPSENNPASQPPIAGDS